MNINRIEQLRSTFENLSIDSFLVTDIVNINYLSGFEGDGVLLITDKQQFIITDLRYELALEDYDNRFEIEFTRNYLGVAADIIEKNGLTVMGFESSISFLEYEQLDEELTSDLVSLTNIVEELRRIKDKFEQEKLVKAGQLADEAFDYIIGTIKIGQTEIEIANRLDSYLKSLGASNESFETIVASGIHSTWPHATVSNRKIQKQDLITIDFGYYYQGYTSDVTRTVAIGSISDELKKIYDTVLMTQEHVISLIKPGCRLSELARVANEMIAEAGYGDYFNHGIGHGIGLSIHELPNIRINDQNGVLMVGDVITIEPGIYVPKLGGVRIEDDILVVENGHQLLTDSYKKLMII